MLDDDNRNETNKNHAVQDRTGDGGVLRRLQKL